MRLFFVAFVSLLFFNSCTEKKNVKKTYYLDGSIASEVNFKDSDTLIKDGEAKFYYPGGKLKKQHFFINDTLNGDFVSYEESGIVQSKGYFKYGVAIGPTYYYHNNNLVLYNERDFENQVYYVKKFDTITHNLIKEEGVCISPNIRRNITSNINEQEVQFFYAKPDGYLNEISVFIKSRPVNFDTLKGHIIKIKINKKSDAGQELKIYSTLKSDKLTLICKDSITYKISSDLGIQKLK
jgi:hypothetical protein